MSCTNRRVSLPECAPTKLVKKEVEEEEPAHTPATTRIHGSGYQVESRGSNRVYSSKVRVCSSEVHGYLNFLTLS